MLFLWSHSAGSHSICRRKLIQILCRSQKLLFLFFSHHIDHHIFEHNEQHNQSQEEDGTTAITKTPVSIQSELRVVDTEHIAHTDILAYHLCKQMHILNVAELLYCCTVHS